jgi:septal ring factor EnvC (AmiA/AmiB activator)
MEEPDVMRALDPFKREAKFRDEVLAVYYKLEDDCDNSEQYDDYLMEVEDMVHALVHGEDVPSIRAKLADYKRKWGELSAVNRSRRSEKLKQICATELRERQEFEQRCAEKLEAEKRRLAGLHSDKQRAQLNIADGRVAAAEDSRATGARAAAEPGVRGLLEQDLFLDPAALPPRMREKKQETQHVSSRSRGTMTEAAAAAAGCSQLGFLRAAQEWAFQMDAVAFLPFACGALQCVPLTES